MQVALHAGAHITDEDRFLKCLMGNEPILTELGTSVPHPGGYRKLMRDLLNEAPKVGISADAGEVLMHAVGFEEKPARLILSNPGFFGTPRMVAKGGLFYRTAQTRMEYFQQIFPKDDLELFIGIRNPATFLPAMVQQAKSGSVAEFIGGGDPADMRWSELIARLRAALPDIPITVWCNEDTPLIWAQVLREIAGVEPTIRMDGEYALLNEIMTPEGMKRFQSYMDSHPDMTEIQRRRVIAAFLDKFADESAIEEELDLPGWTEEVVDHLSDIYDEDVFAIARIPGINLIAP